MVVGVSVVGANKGQVEDGVAGSHVLQQFVIGVVVGFHATAVLRWCVERRPFPGK